MGKRFRTDNLDQTLLLPPSLHDWLPEGHLARFIADVPEKKLLRVAGQNALISTMLSDTRRRLGSLRSGRKNRADIGSSHAGATIQTDRTDSVRIVGDPEDCQNSAKLPPCTVSGDRDQATLPSNAPP
ncbi:MAG: hypothetical protein ACKV2U_30415 [Bryobacteraceae bacterium]